MKVGQGNRNRPDLGSSWEQNKVHWNFHNHLCNGSGSVEISALKGKEVGERAHL